MLELDPTLRLRLYVVDRQSGRRDPEGFALKYGRLR
jgi:hypothetical protein